MISGRIDELALSLHPPIYKQRTAQDQFAAQYGQANSAVVNQQVSGHWLASTGASIADPAAITGPVFIPKTTTTGTWNAAVNTPKITYSTGGTAGTKSYSAASL